MFGRDKGTTTGRPAKPGEAANTTATRATGTRKAPVVKAKPPKSQRNA